MLRYYQATQAAVNAFGLPEESYTFPDLKEPDLEEKLFALWNRAFKDGKEKIMKETGYEVGSWNIKNYEHWKRSLFLTGFPADKALELADSMNKKLREAIDQIDPHKLYDALRDAEFMVYQDLKTIAIL